jgi:hypothetical protein
MKMKSQRPRRATILLMVVSLLALLFVIVTGFLALARVDRGVVVDLRRADLSDAIAEDTNALAMSLIRDQLVDDTGRVLGGGGPQTCSLEDISGYRNSNWLAPLEPVWDPTFLSSQFGWTGSWTVLEQLLWPAVTSLDASVSLDAPAPRRLEPARLFELMRDYDFSQLAFGGGSTGFTNVQWNARNPFMDADGDGVPDSHFLITASATELANAAAGRWVQLPAYDDATNPNRFLIYAIPPAGWVGLNYEKWQRYNEQARYDVALRIISHGGMVTLDSPTLYTAGNVAVTPFNRDFVVDQFDANRDPRDRRMSMLYNTPADEDRLFDELHANTAEVERGVRRRFLLPPAADLDGRRAVRRVPPILAELQGELTTHDGFPRTFLPSLGGVQQFGEPENWQRINVGGDEATSDRLPWAWAVSLDPTTYDVGGNPALDRLRAYDTRHLITTVNYSDDLARKQAHGDPDPLDATLNNRLKSYRGELKFYLGEASKAYVDLGGGRYAYDYRRGAVIVQRLARLFYDMLDSHDASDTDGWGTVFEADKINSTDPEQVVSRRQQAFMLAVNTVAFAAPRDDDRSAERGRIDVVSYVDADAPGIRTPEYVGYAPQPFFSEAIAYNEDQDDGDDHVAIAVELYNPNDLQPGFDATAPDNDPFALYLPQFAIAVGGVNPNAEVPGTHWRPLGDNPEFQGLPPIPNLAQRMSGRSFLTFAIRDSTPSGTHHFDSYVGTRTLSLDIRRPGTSDRVKLDLWRQGRYYDSATNTAYWRWFHVDRIQVFYPNRGDWASRYRDLAQAIHPTLPDPALSHQPYFGVVGGIDEVGQPVSRWARWSVVCAWDDDDTSDGESGFPHNEGGPTSGSPPSAIALRSALGASGQGAPAWFQRNAQNLEPLQPTLPIVPLMTMNAGPVGTTGALYERLNNLAMFGNPDDLRPRSFPTVGFMLFVPRYSHVHQVMLPGPPTPVFPTNLGIVATRTMSQTLEKERYRKHSRAANPWQVPADFGHMPIFDNTQAVKSGSYFDNTNGVGAVPWGLLVFDYFTTLNPVQDRNGDSQPDVDPLRIPGRININTAPWYVLANLPMLGPDASGYLPIIPTGSGTPPAAYPSPSFWDPNVAVLSGVVNPGPSEHHRLLATDPVYTHGGFDVPWAADASVGRYRLGPWLAQAAAAYRDGVQYLPDPVNYSALPFARYADSHLRGGNGAQYGPPVNPASAPAYRPATYGVFPGGGTPNGGIRGAAQAVSNARPQEYGFVTVGELLNVKGFDSSRHNELPAFPGDPPQNTALGRGDFVKAVSLMVLLDSQYLTTRSNTFTIYASVMDREDPQASVRSQVTVDRSNLLPRLTYAFYDPATGSQYSVAQADLTNPTITQLPLVPLLLDLQPQPITDGIPETPIRLTNDDAEPQVVAEQRVGYFNARYDD